MGHPDQVTWSLGAGMAEMQALPDVRQKTCEFVTRIAVDAVGMNRGLHLAVVYSSLSAPFMIWSSTVLQQDAHEATAAQPLLLCLCAAYVKSSTTDWSDTRQPLLERRFGANALKNTAIRLALSAEYGEHCCCSCASEPVHYENSIM